MTTHPFRDRPTSPARQQAVGEQALDREISTIRRRLGPIGEFPLVAATVLVGVVAGVFALFGFVNPAGWLVIAFAGAVGLHLAIRAVRDLIGGHTGVDVLAVTAIAATLATGELAAAMVIVLMMTGGEALEDYAAGRARRELTALLAGAPRLAHVVEGDVIRDIPTEQVQVGHVLLVRPSEMVPVDGTLDSAAATLDESSLTGESLPVDRVAGEQVFSGAINGMAAITVTASATVADSQYSQIIRLVREATQSKSKVVRLADRYAVPFTVLAFVIAIAAWIFSGSATQFAAVLVVATPCPLLIAAPVAFLGGISRAARRGIIVKSSTALEVASRVRTIAFDKTGTLTQGRPKLVSIVPAADMTEDRLLALAAAAEQYSSHVLASSVTAAALERGLKLPSAIEGREQATHGVSAVVDGHPVRVGKRSFVAETARVVTELDLLDGQMAVYVGVDDSYAGALLMADAPRPEAAGTVRRLRYMGIKNLMMVTGDAEPTARSIAQRVGISEIHAGCLPAEKVAIVAAQPGRPVMMVGDGVNDAPVIASADIGVALGARGVTAAAESADVVILPDRLDLVADTITIGRRTVRVALESIWLGIALSVALMGVAAFGYLPPLFGALSQEVVDLLAIGNALRALTPGRRHHPGMAGRTH
ncbi:MAG: heavy metal translocating P-type ATPase [Nakamurella sp.]